MSQLHPDTMIIDLPKNDFDVYADPLFEKVFLNLIDNTRKHGGKVSRINISSRETDRGLIICFEDDGNGIASENKTHIFERGYGKHTGLGLFFSREILSITGITITENGKPGRGVRFEILVPKGLYKFTKAGTKKGRKGGSTSKSAE
jgi:signal transduction histidine kinase